MLRRSSLGWVFVLLAFLPAMSSAATIVVEYQIRGGTTSGSLLGGESIQSGSVALTIDASITPPPTSTVFFNASWRYFSIDLYLLGTGGATHRVHHPTDLLDYNGGFLVGLVLPSQRFALINATMQFNFNYISTPGFTRRAHHRVYLSGLPQPLTGRVSTSVFTRNPAGTFSQMGSATFFGREVGVPEPTISSLLAPGLLFLAAVLRIQRRRAALRTP